MKCLFTKVTIIGLGLIGGSLAKALKKYYTPSPFIHAVDTDVNALETAQKEGFIDSAACVLDNSIKKSQAVFICSHVKEISCLMAQAAAIEPNAIITDTGSVKTEVCEYAVNNNIRFIGGHPMAGSQKSGYAAAKEFMFENAYYLLCPTKSAQQGDVELLGGVLSGLGAYPLTINPAEHDKAVAYISHIPHIIAMLLVNTVASADDNNETLRSLAAGGFRDITRIASSNAQMWSNVCKQNKIPVLSGLTEFSALLERFLYAFKADSDLTSYFAEAKKYRDSLEIKSAAYMNEYQIFVDIADKPGMIARVSALLGENGVNIRNIGIVNSREYINGALQIVFETSDNAEKSIEILTQTGFTVYKE